MEYPKMIEVEFRDGIGFTIKIVENPKMKDVLAQVSLKISDQHDRLFVINGFTLRKSKINSRPYLMMPSKSLGMGNGFFRYCHIEKSLFKEIEAAIINQYEYDEIPIIDA